MCQEFTYCGKKCRKRHNFRKCQRDDAIPVGDITANWQAIQKATKALSADETEQKVFSMIMQQQKRRPKSAATASFLMYPIAKTNASSDQMRGLTTVFFKCLPRQWDEEVWRLCARAYFDSVSMFATIKDFKFMIEFASSILESYGPKDPRDSFYDLAQMALTQTQIVDILNGATYDLQTFKDVDHPWQRAQIDFLLSTEPWYDSMTTFFESCASAAVDDNIFVEYRVSAALNAATILYMFEKNVEALTFAEFAMSEEEETSCPTSILCAYVRACPLAKISELIDTYMESVSTHDPTTIQHAIILQRFAESIMAETPDSDRPLLYLADAYAVCKRNNNLIYGLDVLCFMLQIYVHRNDKVNIRDIGAIMLKDFQKIAYDSFTGFYNFYAYADVLETLTDLAFEEKRFNDAWTYAALYYIGHKAWEAWQDEELQPIREYVDCQSGMMTSMTPDRWSDIIKGFAQRRGIVKENMTNDTVPCKHFGDCETAHQVFCESVCLEDDSYEKSYAFVWFETSTFVYAFVVDTGGVLSVRRKSNDGDSAASLLPSMARSLERTPERDTSLVLVNPPEPRLSTCKALEGVCVWNA